LEFRFKAIAAVVSVVGIAVTIYYSGLGAKVAELTKQEAYLTTSIDSLTKSRDSLKNERDGLAKEVEQLRRDANTIELQTDINYAEQVGRTHLLASPKESAELLPAWRLAKAIRESPNLQDSISMVEQRLEQTAELGSKAELLIALFQTTGEAKWRDQLANLFVSSIRDTGDLRKLDNRGLDVMFLVVRAASTWNKGDRLAFSFDALRLVRSSEKSLLSGVVDNLRHGVWSSNLTMDKVDPVTAPLFLTMAAFYRDIVQDPKNLPETRLHALTSLYELSPEMFSAVLAERLANPAISLYERERLADFSRLIPPEFGSPVPDTPDPVKWRDWKEENRELLSPYLERRLGTLRIRLTMPFSGHADD